MSERYVPCRVRQLPPPGLIRGSPSSAPASGAAGRTGPARRVCGNRHDKARGRGRDGRTPARDTARRFAGLAHARNTRCSSRGLLPSGRTRRAQNTSGVWLGPRLRPARFQRRGTPGKARRPQGAGSSRGDGPAAGRLSRSGNRSRDGPFAPRASRHSPGSGRKLSACSPHGGPCGTPSSRNTSRAGGGVCWAAGAS
jgi:hypothetical protein